ncbi:MAG: hypothetical protein RMX96_04630 [Nostoc sp. ChiSLP02]|nr:hypothetical protein [Nostoc sp. DedSLP05]MDZ8102855.1 hypothetical protein [Nostoc sp. DedSLP01]MDZ8184134.1 hypothetical protein [Nostoc sp. ChiSLP02]
MQGQRANYEYGAFAIAKPKSSIPVMLLVCIFVAIAFLMKI